MTAVLKDVKFILEWLVDFVLTVTMKKLTLLILLFFSSMYAVQAQGVGAKFPASAVKADLEYLYKTLENANYNLYAYVSKSEFDKAYVNSLKAISKKDSVSLLQATKLFQKFTATGNIGHTEVDFPAQSYITYAYNGGTVFPLELAFEDGKAFIRKSYTDNPEIRAGQQLLSINKVPVKKIQQEIYPYISAERPYFKDVKLEFWSLPRYYWAVFGEKDTFQVQVKSANGKVETHSLSAIPVLDYEGKRNEITNSQRFFDIKHDVAYLNPGPFSSAKENGEEQFRAFIDSAFADIKSKGVEHLVVDLRNNQGGDNSYSDYLISYFADKPFRWYSKFSLKTSAVLKAQTRQNTPEDKIEDYAKAILSHKNGEVYEYTFPEQKPVDESKRLTGKIYVLVNRHTYSMAAVSAALIQDYNFATIVGEETGDVPTLYASQFSFPLPNTGIVVKAAKGYIVRPNGDERLIGVVPDIKVRDHLIDEKDEILDYTLNKVINSSDPK